MKRLALIAAGTAVIGLSACSNTTAPATAPTPTSASHNTATPPVSASCSRQYQTWDRGPGKGLMATLHAVSVASMAADAQALTVELRNARPDVARATRYPVPPCADPRGYWTILLMHVNAAVSSKGSTSNARAAMKDVPKIEQELTTELKSLSQK